MDVHVEGFDTIETKRGVKLVSDDRKAMVLVAEVQTAAGTVYNCRLFRGEHSHGRKKPITSRIAETVDDIGDVACSLIEENPTLPHR